MWFRLRERRLPSLWAGRPGEVAMVCLACSLVILAFHSVVFLGKTFSSSPVVKPSSGAAGLTASDPVRVDTGASAWQFEPWAEVTHRALADGEAPLWNPYQGFGAPHAANFQSATFDPLLAGVNLHPTPLMWDASLLFAMLLGAAAMFLFLRQEGLSRLPSLVGTAAFSLSGYFILYSNNQFFRGYVYLPVLFFLARRAVVGRGVLAPILLGAAVGAQILIGMPEASAYVLGALALFGLFAVLGRPPGARYCAIIHLGAAAFLGLLLAAPLLVPGIEYLGLSFNTHGPGSAVGLLSDPVRLLLNWISPGWFGLPARNYQNTGWSGTRNWVGAAAVMTAIAAVSSPRAMRRYGGWFFAGLAVVILAKSYGFGALRWTGRLPVLEQTDTLVFGLPVAGFCVAALVGIGCQAKLDGDVRPAWFLGGVGIYALGFGWLIRANRPFFHGAPSGHLLKHLGLAAVAAGLVAVAVVLRHRWAGLLMGAVVLGELVALVPRGYLLPRHEPYPQLAWTRFLSQRVEAAGGRVFGLDAKLFPDTAGAYGFHDIRAVDAVYPERYVDYVREFIQPQFKNRFVGGPYGQAAETAAPAIDDNPMFNLTGVQYLISASPLPGAGRSWARIASFDGTEIYENRHPAPRVSLIKRIVGVPDLEASLRFFRSTRRPDGGAVDTARHDPQTTAVVEGVNTGERAVGGCADAGDVHMTARSARHVEVRYRTACPALIRLSDLYFPGWRAAVNGRSAKIHATDVAFRGVFVDAGEGSVSFTYAPSSFETGTRLAFAGAVGALAAAARRPFLAWWRRHWGLRQAAAER